MKLQRIWNDLKRGTDIDLYATLGVAVVIIVLNVIGLVPESLLVSVTLAVLVFMTISNLVNRNLLEDIRNSQDKNIGDVVEEFPPGFSRDIEQAKEIWLIGVHHSSTMSEHYDSFEKMLRDGGRVRAMVADPEGSACIMTSMRFAGEVDAEQERTRTRENLRLLERLATVKPGTVEIKIFDYLFAYNAVLIDPNSPRGVAYVQRYTFKTMGGARKPKSVHRPGDNRWYDLIRSEILAMWDCGIIWPVPANPETSTPNV